MRTQAATAKQPASSLPHLQVNNAAILVRRAWDEATYKQTLAVDVLRPLALTQQLTPCMPAAAGSLVIMVSSGWLLRSSVARGSARDASQHSWQGSTTAGAAHSCHHLQDS